MTEEQLEQMRADFRLTADREEWSQADRDEIAAVIATAIKAEDEETLVYWAKRLAWWREMLESFAPRLRQFEARVKAEAQAARERLAA